MNKTFFDVQLNNHPQILLRNDKGSQDTRLTRGVEDIVLLICSNCEVLPLVQEGETVSLDNLEVSLHSDDVIKILSQQKHIYLTLREICELSEKFQELKGRIEEVTMEIGFVDYVEHTPDLPEKKVVSCVNVSKVEPGVRESGVREPGVRESGVREPGVREPGVRRDVTPSDYTGHAYMNLEVVDPNNKLQLEDVFKRLEDYNSFDRLDGRKDGFQVVEMPGHPQVDQPSKGETDSYKTSLLSSNDNEKLSYLNPLIDSNENCNLSIKNSRKELEKRHVDSAVSDRETGDMPKGRLALSLRKDQGEVHASKSQTSNSTSSNSTFSNGETLKQTFSPSSDVDSYDVIGGENFVSLLNLYLQKNRSIGSRQCVETEHAGHLHKSFSAKLTFDLHGQHYEFESDTRYKNKKDARQNVSYQACSRLGLASLTGCRPVVTGDLPAATDGRPAASYKSLLQEYSAKNSLQAPVYKSADVGDVHCPRFQCEVTGHLKDGRVYEEKSDFMESKKAAKSQAAERAYIHFVGGRKLGSVTETPLSLPETAPITTTNWKNKLQELLQKNRKPVPRYDTSMTSNGFTSKVLIYTDESPRAFTSEVRCSGKLAEMGAAELAYKALAENNTDILRVGQVRDFGDWHGFRQFLLPIYDTTATCIFPAMKFSSKLTFNDGKSVVTGEEKSSKKSAETSAVLKAVEVLKESGLWDL